MTHSCLRAARLPKNLVKRHWPVRQHPPAADPQVRLWLSRRLEVF
ncbi:MAG: hypothetical protein QNJ46_29575 [Leptolyngbyaceae cyanobacterium MO_188.B28]|nr:hypothetical protein [Leptolyngbyaceae cyanobacterium MO_188.B28]